MSGNHFGVLSTTSGSPAYHEREQQHGHKRRLHNREGDLRENAEFGGAVDARGVDQFVRHSLLREDAQLRIDHRAQARLVAVFEIASEETTPMSARMVVVRDDPEFIERTVPALVGAGHDVRRSAVACPQSRRWRRAGAREASHFSEGPPRAAHHYGPGVCQPIQSQNASPITKSRSAPCNQGNSSVNRVTHWRHVQCMRVMSVPQNMRRGPNASNT